MIFLSVLFLAENATFKYQDQIIGVCVCVWVRRFRVYFRVRRYEICDGQNAMGGVSFSEYFFVFLSLSTSNLFWYLFIYHHSTFVVLVIESVSKRRKIIWCNFNLY